MGYKNADAFLTHSQAQAILTEERRVAMLKTAQGEDSERLSEL